MRAGDFAVERLGTQYVIRDVIADELVMDGLIPVMRSTREDALREIESLRRQREEE